MENLFPRIYVPEDGTVQASAMEQLGKRRVQKGSMEQETRQYLDDASARMIEHWKMMREAYKGEPL